MSYSDMAAQVTGGGMFKGAQQGLAGPSAAFGGRRRRRGLFGAGGHGLFRHGPAHVNPVSNPANPAAPRTVSLTNPSNPIGTAQNMANIPGSSFLKDPMMTDAIGEKLKNARNATVGMEISHKCSRKWIKLCPVIFKAYR